MREVDTKTGGAKATNVNGDVVTMRHTTLHKASGKHFELTTIFDFNKVSSPERTRLAAEMLLIRWRTAFKNAETVGEESDNEIVQVSEMLSRTRQKLSPREKLDRLGMSRDEILALLDEDQDEDEKDDQ